MPRSTQDTESSISQLVPPRASGGRRLLVFLLVILAVAAAIALPSSGFLRPKLAYDVSGSREVRPNENPILVWQFGLKNESYLPVTLTGANLEAPGVSGGAISFDDNGQWVSRVKLGGREETKVRITFNSFDCSRIERFTTRQDLPVKTRSWFGGNYTTNVFVTDAERYLPGNDTQTEISWPDKLTYTGCPAKQVKPDDDESVDAVTTLDSDSSAEVPSPRR